MISKNKSNTIILIAVRLKSQRLKNKALLKINNVPMILALHYRLMESKLAKEIIWCTSTHKDDKAICDLAKKNKINFVRGSELNVLLRFSKAIKSYKSDNIVRVTGDNPLTDPKIIDRMIKIHEKNQYDYTYCDLIPNGTRAEVISNKAINFCLKNIKEPNNSEYMTWMFNRPDIYKVHRYTLKNKSIISPMLNFTVDNKREYYNVVRVFKKFNCFNFSLSSAIKYVNSNKKLLRSYIVGKKITKNIINISYKFD